MIYDEPARGKLIRSLALYGPLALISGAGAIYSLIDLNLFVLIVGGAFALLTGYQAVQALRDLGAPMVTTVGPVRRKWARNDFVLFGRTHYIRIGDRIFIVDRASYLEIEEDDVLSVEHYPHTGMVGRIELVPEEPEPDPRRGDDEERPSGAIGRPWQ